MSPALLLVPAAHQCPDSTVGRGWRGQLCCASPSTAKQGGFDNRCRCSQAPPCSPLYARGPWDEPSWGRAVGTRGPVATDCPSARSRLHSNHLFCDCHLAWLSQWLRQRPTIGLFTQCAAPAQLRGLNVAEIQKNEFSCSGEGDKGGGGCQGRDVGPGAKPVPSVQPTSTPCHVPRLRAWMHMVGSAQVSAMPGVGTTWGHHHLVSVTKGASVCALGAACLLHGAEVHQDLVHPLKGATSCPCTPSCHRGPFLGVLPSTCPAQLFATPMLAASLAGQTDPARVQLCSLSSGSCPAMCTCSNGIVDCRGKGLTAIPANLPETMTEM